MSMISVVDQIERGRESETSAFRKMKDRLFRRYRDYSVTFGSEEGRRVLADLCKTAGVFDTGIGKGDVVSLAYQAGARDFALQCLNLSGQGKFDIDRRIQELDQG